MTLNRLEGVLSEAVPYPKEDAELPSGVRLTQAR